jgi:hypothetical protein
LSHQGPEEATHAATDRSPAPRPDPAAGQSDLDLLRSARVAAKPQRSVTSLQGIIRLHLQLRNCRNPDCRRRGVCLRPEQEGRFALPHHEFGLDVLALVRRLHHAEHRSIPQIRTEDERMA